MARAGKAILTSPELYGAHTMAAVRVGNTIVTTLESMRQSDLTAGAVALAETLAAKVKAAGG